MENNRRATDGNPMFDRRHSEDEKLNVLSEQLAVLVNEVKNVKENVEAVKQLIERKYVTQLEFLPIRNLVYGLIGLILTAVVGGLLSLVVKK
jgi:hypothetical protein